MLRPSRPREASATFLLAQGMTLEDVKRQLGHSTILLTSDTYGHVLERRQWQVAAASRGKPREPRGRACTGRLTARLPCE